MIEKIICEKCGAEMVPIDPEKPVGMECPKCGWGWATTYIEPKYEDPTVYKIVLNRGNDDTKDNLKLVAKIMNCNLLKAKAVISETDTTLAAGKAFEIEGFIDLLVQSTIKYHIEPEWPY